MAKEKHIFLALVPHRDIRLELRKYSDMLFRAGFAGAYHFPWVAPLAALSRPLNDGELKRCSRAIKEAAGGKILAHEAAAISFPAGEGALFGPRLNFTINPQALDIDRNAIKETEIYSPHIIGSCLLPAVREIPIPPVTLSFRAAAAANMIWRPIRSGGTVIGFKWKIGNLIWLAK